MCFDGDGLYSSDDDEREVNVTTGKGGKKRTDERIMHDNSTLKS